MGGSSAPAEGSRVQRFKHLFMPSFGAVMVHIATLFVVVVPLYAAYLAWRPSPIRSIEILGIEPPNRIINREMNDHLTIRRRVCAREALDATLERSWIDEAGGIQQVLDDHVHIAEGCHDRPAVHIYPPTGLNEGIHRYRARLRWCDPFCRDFQLDDVEVIIIGKRPFYARPAQTDRF